MVIPLGLAQAPISLREFQLSEKLPKKRSLLWPPLPPPPTPLPLFFLYPTDLPPNPQHSRSQKALKFPRSYLQQRKSPVPEGR